MIGFGFFVIFMFSFYSNRFYLFCSFVAHDHFGYEFMIVGEVFSLQLHGARAAKALVFSLVHSGGIPSKYILQSIAGGIPIGPTAF